MRKTGKSLISILLLIISCTLIYAQEFPAGTNAIHKDSLVISGWATHVDVVRGYINISDTTKTYTEGGITSNKAWFGTPENATGQANGQLVSFGDAGYAIARFAYPVSNGPGADFAVFSNAMFSPSNQTAKAFVELAFVEVSSDGINYERFPAISNMQYHTQISSFQTVEWNLYENFAGIYPVFYGVPFDLDDIPGETVDKNNITHIKIIDAIGCINPDYASYDSQGNIVNFAWPTPFHTGGFDLDAVAVINSGNTINQNIRDEISVYPNPAKDFVIINNAENSEISIYNINGSKVLSGKLNNNRIDIENLPAGVYFISIADKDYNTTKKLLKIE